MRWCKLLLPLLAGLVYGETAETTYYELTPNVCDQISACTLNDTENALNSLTESTKGANFTTYEWSDEGKLRSISTYFCEEMDKWVLIPAPPLVERPAVVYGECHGTNKLGQFHLNFTLTAYFTKSTHKWRVTGGLVGVSQ